jgi:hypothetical protein
MSLARLGRWRPQIAAGGVAAWGLLIALPSWWTGVGALVSAALFVIGVLHTTMAAVTGAATVTLVNYAIALRLAGRAPDVLAATAVGVTLALVFEIVDFERRTGGAGIDPAVIRSQVRHWAGLILGGTAACLGVTVCALALALAMPPVAAPVAVAVGVLTAFVAAVWALGRHDSTVSPLDPRRGTSPRPTESQAVGRGLIPRQIKTVEGSRHEDPGHL